MGDRYTLTWNNIFGSGLFIISSQLSMKSVILAFLGVFRCLLHKGQPWLSQHTPTSWSQMTNIVVFPRHTLWYPSANPLCCPHNWSPIPSCFLAMSLCLLHTPPRVYTQSLDNKEDTLALFPLIIIEGADKGVCHLWGVEDSSLCGVSSWDIPWVHHHHARTVVQIPLHQKY